MDTNTAIILIVVIFAVVVIVGFILYRRRSKVDINTPLGNLSFEGGSDFPPEQSEPTEQKAIVVKDAKSRKGGLKATDKTGRGISAEGVDVEKDIVVTSETPDENSAPKV